MRNRPPLFDFQRSRAVRHTEGTPLNEYQHVEEAAKNTRHYKHNRLTSVPSVGFESAILATERLHTTLWTAQPQGSERL